MPVQAVVVKTALLSGALAGLAGCIEVVGRAGYVTLDMSPGYGYSGIVIAMLAQLNPIGVVAAAIFIAGILVGADSMSRAIAGADVHRRRHRRRFAHRHARRDDARALPDPLALT
jgi:simple sugar transport system permease protein